MSKRLFDSTISSRRSVSSFERLESRTLLAAAAAGSLYVVKNIPIHIPLTENIADVKSGPMANSSQQIVDLYREYRKYRKAGGVSSEFESSLSDRVLFVGDKVGVTVRGREGINALTTTLRELGAQILYRSGKYSVIEALVPVTQLHSLARDPQVATINAISRPVSHQQGNANNQADETQVADEARTVYGLDGTGVKVGVLSDSVNLVGTGIAGSISTGNLPAGGVQVISDLAPEGTPELYTDATDEGRAMLELIHDLAPGADLAFATASLGTQAFAENIRALRAAGSDVIVDDIVYFTEPFFQPGVIDQAIADVVRDGAVYLSAAGNYADSGYESPTNWTKQGRDRFVDFDAGPGVDTRMRIEVDGGPVIFQWDNAWNGVVGNVTADLDIYFYDPNYPNRIVAVGNTNNIKTGSPVEIVNLRPGRFDVVIRLADSLPGTTLPTRFKFAGPFGLGQTEYTTGTRSATFGHNSGPNTISVGAVPFSAAPPYIEDDVPIIAESFSSTGPVIHTLDTDGARMTRAQTIQKPDIAGIDNINTSFFGQDAFTDDDSLPNFGGTSAAAPNVAAVVALIRQAAPDATQDQILAALKSTARPVNGSPTGEWDPQGGFGLIDARASVEQFVKQPTVRIEPVSPDSTDSAVSEIKIIFSQQVSGFDVGDLTLRVDDGPNLLTGGNGPFTSDGGRTWFLQNLADLTADPGTYVLELNDIVTPITNPAGLDLAEGTTESWVKLPPPPRPDAPSNLLTKVISDTEVRLRWSDNSDNENGFTIQRAENEAFTENLKTIHVPAGTTVYTDKTITPTGRTLYYRVRAFNNFSGSSSYSNKARATTLSPGEIILDNESSSGVRVSGSWATESSVPGSFGSSYLSDTNSGKGDKSVRYTPNFEFGGDYYVFARWTRATDRATNVPIDVFFNDDGETAKQTVTVNQRSNGGTGWVLLGKFNFRRGTFGSVQIRNAGTNGVVVADAVRFLSTEGGIAVPPSAS